MAKVIIIDDDDLIRYTLSKVLRKAGHEVVETSDSMHVSEMILTNQPDVVLTDIIMPDKEGIELISEIREKYPAIPIIAMSGGGRDKNIDYLDIALTLGANVALKKPFDENQLLDHINQLVNT